MAIPRITTSTTDDITGSANKAENGEVTELV
jgi:hypothetical protein